MKRTISAAILAAVVSSSTSFAQVPERREATVDYVWFKGTPRTDSVGGGTSPATLRVEPGNGTAAVGVIEEFAGGTGAQWRSTAWIAAFTASSRAKQSFLANEFTIKSGGHVDGPSAGMLTTATFLALLRGDVVKPDVTMTGTINPDGTCGPVGGIPQKLAGAAAAGKKVFGYPLGMRQSEDMRTGSVVDVEGLATSLGVRAVEVKTLRDAYLLLTGVDLGGAASVDASTLRASPELVESLRIRVDMWRASAESSFARIKPVLDAMPANERQTLSWVTSPIFAAVKQGVAYEKAGQLLAAEQKWMEVAVATAAAEDELAILDAAKLGKLEQAFGVLLPYLDLEDQAKTMLREVGDALHAGGSTATVDAVLAAESVVAALAEIRAGKSGLQAAVNTIKQLEKGGGAANAERIERFLLLLVKTAPVLARAESTLAAARMDLAFAGVDASSSTTTTSSARLTSLTKAYASAASAGKAYFESLVGLDEASSASFAFMEPAWAAASMGADVSSSLVTQASSSKTADVDRVLALAAGAQAYLSAAALQNKYYALEYKDGVVARRSALAAQLASAREAALGAIGDVKRSTGVVPARIVVELNRAEELKDGASDDDRLAALSAYWRASFAAELLSELSTTTTTTTTTSSSLPTLRLPPEAAEPVVKKGVKPSKKLPPKKPTPPPKKKIKAK